QIVNTLRGLAVRGMRENLLLLAHRLTPGQPQQFDFYAPLVREAGIEVREIRERENRWFDFTYGLPQPMHAALRHLPFRVMAEMADHYREFMELKPSVVHAWLDWSNVRAGLAAVLAGVPRIILAGRNLNPGHFFFDAPYFQPAYQALAEHSQVLFINN